MPRLAGGSDADVTNVSGQMGQWADSLAMPLVAVTRGGDVLYANREFLEVTGTTEEELRGQPIGAVLHELSDRAVRDAIAGASASGHGMWVDVLVRARSGGYLAFRAGVSRLGAAGAELAFSLVFRQDELSRLALVLEHSAEGVLVTDSKGRVLYANASAAAMAGSARERLIGRFLAELIPDCADLLHSSAEGSRSRLTGVRAGGGSLRWVSVRSLPLLGCGPAECGWAVLMEDASDRVLLEVLRRALLRFGRAPSARASDVLLGALVDTLGFESASGWVLGPDRASLRGLCEARPGGVLEDITDADPPEWLCRAWKSLAAGEVQYVHGNLPGWEQDTVVVPLKAGERLLGVITARAWGGCPVSDDHLQWLRALAGALALVLDHEAATAEVEAAVRMAELAVEMARASAAPNRDAVLHALWTQARDVLDVQRMIVWEADTASGSLKCVFAADRTASRTVRAWRRESRKAEEAAVSARPVFTERGRMPLACLPMVSERGLLGVLCVVRPRPFNEADRVFLDVLAAFAGTSLERDRQMDDRCEAARRELFAQLVRTVNHHVNNSLQAMMANAHLLGRDAARSGPGFAARLDALLEACYRLADFTERLRRTTSITTVETAGGQVLELAPSDEAVK